MLYAISRLRERSADHVGLMFHFAAVIEKLIHGLLERKTTIITQASVYPNLLEWIVDRTTQKQAPSFITLYGQIKC